MCRMVGPFFQISGRFQCPPKVAPRARHVPPLPPLPPISYATAGQEDSGLRKIWYYFFSFSQNCATDPSTSIQNRIGKLRDAYTACFMKQLGSYSLDVARSRFQLGVRLYYRVMEAMLKRVSKPPTQLFCQ